MLKVHYTKLQQHTFRKHFPEDLKPTCWGQHEVFVEVNRLED